MKHTTRRANFPTAPPKIRGHSGFLGSLLGVSRLGRCVYTSSKLPMKKLAVALLALAFLFPSLSLAATTDAPQTPSEIKAHISSLKHQIKDLEAQLKKVDGTAFKAEKKAKAKKDAAKKKRAKCATDKKTYQNRIILLKETQLDFERRARIEASPMISLQRAAGEGTDYRKIETDAQVAELQLKLDWIAVNCP